MKRFWLILLSIGLIAAFSSAAYAADAKFSGEYLLQGWYNKNHSLIDKDDSATTITNRGSTAFYTQRLRIGMDINVVKGLKLSTRFDALERKWMAARKATPTSNGVTSTDNEAENIQFDVAYVTFATPFGMFSAGSNCPVHDDGYFGTPFSDNGAYAPNHGFFYNNAWGAFSVSGMMKKGQDNYGTHTYGDTGTGTDNDSNTYQITGQYRWETGATGFALGYYRNNAYNYPATATSNNGGFKREIPYMTLWARNKFGKIFIADELGLVPFGKYTEYNEPKTAAQQNVEGDMALSNYFNIEVDLAPAKAGFIFIFSRGDDPNTADKLEGGFRQRLDIDRNFNPCLILWNEDYMTWMGGGTNNLTQTGLLKGNAGSFGVGTWVQNVWLYQIYGSFRATPKLSFDASYTYAYADKKPTHNGKPVSAGGIEFVSDKYGSEFDVTMKYKIYDNLEYSISGAYLWTGDYFKGTNAKVKLSDTYLITHKLELIF